LDRSDAIHAANRSADRATNRREAADFELASPAIDGRSLSGSRTARLNLRVETVLGVRRRPGRQRKLMTLIAAYPRAIVSGALAPFGRRLDLPSGV
jgi:hypothetical protein